MKKLNIEFETYSPLFIGSNDSDSIPPFGYIKDEKKGVLKVIDFDALIESIKDLRIVDQLTKDLSNNDNFSLENFCKDNQINYEDFVREKIEVDNQKDFFNSKDKKVVLQRFIRNVNGYYIPGSSIKGAVETALEYWYYSKNIKEFLKIVRDVLNGEENSSKNKAKLINDLNSRLKKELLHFFAQKLDEDKKIKKKDKIESADVFSFLGFADSPSFGYDNVKVFVIERERVDGRSQSNKGVTFKEGVKEGVKFNLIMTLDESVFGNNVLFEAIRKFGNDTIDDDIKIPKFEPFYLKLKESLGTNNNLLPINLGFGSSLKTKTLYLLLKSAYLSGKLDQEIVRIFKEVYTVKDPFGAEYPRTRDVVKRLGGTIAVPGWVIMKP